MFLNSTEVEVTRGFGGRVEVCRLQGLIDGVDVWEQPTCRKLTCYWLEKLRKVEEGSGVLPYTEGLESEVSHWVGGNLLFGSLCVFAVCVSEFL